MRVWYTDRWATLKEAAGFRRYLIGGIVATVLAIVGAFAGQSGMSWLLGIPGWTVVIITLLAATALWLLNYATVLRKEKEPKLSCAFDMDDPGCVRKRTVLTQIDKYGNVIDRTPVTYYRVKVIAASSATVTGANGRLISMSKNGDTLISGENINLTFASADLPDAIAKTIRTGAPEYLDILIISDDNVVRFAAHNNRIPSTIDPDKLFIEPGNYEIDIRIVSDNAQFVSLKFSFKWTGDRETIKEMTCRVANTLA